MTRTDPNCPPILRDPALPSLEEQAGILYNQARAEQAIELQE